jgi:hypothetical protein
MKVSGHPVIGSWGDRKPESRVLAFDFQMAR